MLLMRLFVQFQINASSSMFFLRIIDLVVRLIKKSWRNKKFCASIFFSAILSRVEFPSPLVSRALAIEYLATVLFFTVRKSSFSPLIVLIIQGTCFFDIARDYSLGFATISCFFSFFQTPKSLLSIR